MLLSSLTQTQESFLNSKLYQVLSIHYIPMTMMENFTHITYQILRTLKAKYGHSQLNLREVKKLSQSHTVERLLAQELNRNLRIQIFLPVSSLLE